MASLRDIKRRIESVKNTQKITRAMKMVSAAKLRRAQESIQRARPYALRMRTMVNNLAQRAELDGHPLLSRGSDSNKVGLLVVTSDRGLCGGFNSNIVNAARERVSTQFANQDAQLTVIGKKGVELFQRHPVNITTTYTGVLERPLMESSGEIVGEAVREFSEGNLTEIYCLYNHFQSAIAQNLTLERLLPFEPSAGPEGKTAVDYLYEPSAPNVFAALLSKHMQIQMHRILNESAASEQGARMTAMDAATTNAGEMIEKLTLQYNRARQDAITTELIEVVSGAEAL